MLELTDNVWLILANVLTLMMLAIICAKAFKSTGPRFSLGGIWLLVFAMSLIVSSIHTVADTSGLSGLGPFVSIPLLTTVLFVGAVLGHAVLARFISSLKRS